MSTRALQPHDTRTAASVIEALHGAGITEDDPDFAELLSAETDLPALLRELYRASRRADAEADGLAAWLKAEAGRVTIKRERAERLRDIMLHAMLESGLASLDAPEGKVSVRYGIPPLVGEPDPRDLPDHLCRIARHMDAKAVRDALKAGEAVPGVVLGNAQPHIARSRA